MTDPRTYPEDIASLLELSCDADPRVRAKAARSLCPCRVQYNDPLVWDRLIAMASDPELEVRKEIFHTLGDGSPNERHAEVLQAMQSMYQDPDPGLRRRVRKLLAQYKKTGKINIL